MSIFWDFSNYDKIELLPCPIITTGTQDMGNGVYKLAAGTPLKKSTQAVSNDANADCVVAEDYFFISTKADQSKLVPVITKGYVDKARAEAAWGGAFTDAAVSALETAGIFLVDGALEAGGDPGYDVETETVSVIPEQTVTPTMGQYQYEADLTLAAGVDAAPDSLTVVADGVEYTTTVIDIPQIRGKQYDTDDFGIVIGLLSPLDTNLSAQIYSPSLPESITVEAYNKETTVTVTDEFKAAVDAAAGGGTFFIGIESDGDGYTMRETWAAIMAASTAGKYLVGVYQDGASATTYFPIIQVSAGEDSYGVMALGYDENSQYGPLWFDTNTTNGYPSYEGIA